MKVEVTENVSDPRQAGQRTVREQEIFVHLKDAKYPVRSKIGLWGDEPVIQAGEYDIDLDHCVFVGRFEQLQLGLKAQHFVKPAGK